MATTTTNYGWGNPANGDAQGTAELLLSATIDAIDADLWGVAQAIPAPTRWEALTNGDPENPELVFGGDGDLIYFEVPA